MRQIGKRISDYSMDLEIINPIESKTLLGGYDLYELTISGQSWNYGGSGSTWTGGNWGSSSGSGGGDYGSTGGGGGGGSEYGPGNLPGTVEQQLGSMGACVSYAMAFMSTVLGHQIDGGMMAVRNGIALKVNMDVVMSVGLSGEQASQAIQAYFNTNSLSNTSQLTAALDAGHGVLANYSGHEVAIVDYNGSTYTVADSNTGSYIQIAQNQVEFNNGVYEVLSVK